jgi:hypothetical protein
LNAHVSELIAGAFLLIEGIVGIIRKRVSFGLGSGRFGSASPGSTITLTESRAVFLGRVCTVEGGIIIALWLAYFGDEVLGRWLGFVAAVALILALLVFAVCAIFELSEPLMAKEKRDKKKKRSE